MAAGGSGQNGRNGAGKWKEKEQEGGAIEVGLNHRVRAIRSIGPGWAPLRRWRLFYLRHDPRACPERTGSERGMGPRTDKGPARRRRPGAFEPGAFAIDADPQSRPIAWTVMDPEGPGPVTLCRPE